MVFKSQTKRFCRSCLEFRIFQYNKNIGHSECSECAGRVSIHPDMYDCVLESIKKKHGDLFNQNILIKQLQDKIKNQQGQIRGMNEKIKKLKKEE